MDIHTFLLESQKLIDPHNDISPQEYKDRFEVLLQYIIPKVDELTILDAWDDYAKLYGQK